MNSTGVAVKVEELSQVKKKLSFDVSWDDVKKEMDDVYKKVSKTAKIKGFRNGKVPRKILESFYKEHAESETITNIINKYYWDALKDNDISAISQPEVDQNGIEENKNFSFTATVEIEPVIEPEGYIGIKIDKEDFEITEEDVETRLQEIRKMYATLEDIDEDRDVRQGDSILIDFQGSLHDKQLDELKAENYMLEIGSKSFVPGFEEQLIGMKKDESKQISVLFPEDYHLKYIAGENVSFVIALKGIKEKKLPELDDNFIKNFERYESLESLKDEIRRSLEEECKMRSNSSFKNKILEKLLEKNEFEAPPSFVERRIYYMIADTQKRMTSGGMDNKDATELSLKLHDQFKDEAVKIIKSSLLLKNIAKKESITVNEQEIDDRIREMAQKNRQDFKALKNSFERDDAIATIESDILNEKIFKYLEEKAETTVIKKNSLKDLEDK